MAKILVIDDDPDLVTAVEHILASQGHTVLKATSGSEGLAKIQEDPPDLIILDVMMDTTTEGFQVSLRLRNPDPGSPFAAYRSIPIIMLTSIHKTTPLRFEPTDDYLPVDAFLEKPIIPDLLVKTIENHLAGT
ncbi:MAG: response regulator [Anaerolineales bacterium]|nr:MAG: response regulator [Anaerolineales bacterium]